MKNVLSIQSHVIYGHAGNSAAVFPMQRLGVNVWPLNTVQLSNHMQYGHWAGSAIDAAKMEQLVDGIAAIGALKRCDAVLSGFLGSPPQARAAVEIAAKNFDNFNLDLMFALPNQTLDECRTDIETALSYAPPHLSLYHLTLEPNTLFAKFPPVVPDDDASADMQEWIHARTAEAGYGRYEVSAYAKPNHQCKHNLNYWRFGDYLGIGAGAHTKLSFPNRILRQARYKHPATFIEQAMAGTAVQEEREVGARDLPFEFMLNTLRLVEGFPVHSFAERTGLPMSTIEPALQEAERRGLIARDFAQIAPTPLGQRFLNDLQELFLRDD